MTVYGVRASEWETDYNCFVQQKKLLNEKRKD